VTAVTSFRANFIVRNISVILESVAGAASLALVFRLGGGVSGWSVYDWLFLVGLAALARALWDTFFIGTIFLPQLVRAGELDTFLIRPVSPLVLVLMREVDPDTWGEICTSTVLLVVAGVGSGMPFHVWTIPYALVAISGGVAVYAGLHLLVNSTAFAVTDSSPFSSILWRLDDFTRLPMSFFPKWGLVGFSTVVPLAFVNYYPTLILLGRNAPWYAWLTPLVGVLTFAVAVLAWRVGVRRYVGTGS